MGNEKRPAAPERTRTVIFAGAGASTAVNAKNFPTTREFFARLPTEVSEHRLFLACVDYIKEHRKGTVIDIESVLWIIEELKAFARLLNDQKTVPGWLLRSQRLAAALDLNQNFDAMLSVVERSEQTLLPLVHRINQQVYSFYRTVPNVTELKGNWMLLLEKVFSAFRGSVDIFTTNYDMVIERAVHEVAQRDIGNPRIHTGRADNGIHSTLDITAWNRDREDASRDGLLTKLHGSLHWSQGGDQIYVGDPFYKGSDDRQVILYPGFKGVPDREPFATFHLYLERTLLEAQQIIFVGFAFRDDHLNTIFSRSIAPECNVVIINPDPSIDVPLPPNSFQHLQLGFDEEAISRAIADLQSVGPSVRTS